MYLYLFFVKIVADIYNKVKKGDEWKLFKIRVFKCLVRIISKDLGYLSKIERYDLDDILCETKDGQGLVVCYAIAMSNDIILESVDLEAEYGDIGTVQEWHERYSEEEFYYKFPRLADFLRAYNYDDFGLWTVKLKYLGIDVAISGRRNETEIGLSYPKNIEINLLHLLSNIETSTYKFSNCDKRVLNLLSSKFELSNKRAVLTLKKLERHKDIYDEFVSTLVLGKYPDENNAITVNGYSAEFLENNYSLSMLGAYNYLIYLRENPEEAFRDLEKGLPKK